MIPHWVAYVNDNQNITKAVASFAFGSGTLQGQLLAGEKHFSIELDDNNLVRNTLLVSISKLAQFLSLIGYPYVHFQENFQKISYELGFRDPPTPLLFRFSVTQEKTQKQMKPKSDDFKNHHPFSFSTSAFVKFAVCFLLLGLVFSSTIKFSSATIETSLVHKTLPPPLDIFLVSTVFPVDQIQTSHNVTEKCDVFRGQWVPDPSGPSYTHESCHEIESRQNCLKNGRPDSGYLYWRWKPQGCELPKFSPHKFLDLMRNKSWAFIGDSISRNHGQSLICILSQLEQTFEVYHDKENKKSITWHFPSHNFTLTVIWTPFLLKYNTIEDIYSPEIQLHLDTLDTLWTEQYKNFDYMMIAGGIWFLKPAIYYKKNRIKGCHSCPGKNLTELGFDHAYRKALQLTFNFITSSNHKAYVFYRTTTPDHFENGEWFNGGYCNRTAPFKEDEADLNTVQTTMRNVELVEFEKAVEIGTAKGLNLKLFDTTHLSLMRPDGHPGVYSQVQPFAKKDKNAEVQNDCLHWCLPGPLDSWNDLLMNILVEDPMSRTNFSLPSVI